MIVAHAQFVLRNMESVGRGPDSAIASGSASAAGVSLAVASPSRAGVCGVNSIKNLIHGGVTATVLSSSLPRPTHLQKVRSQRAHFYLLEKSNCVPYVLNNAHAVYVYRPYMYLLQVNYQYKVKILNPQKRKKAVTRQLHDFNGRFSTIECLKDHICKELHSEFPRRTLLNVGYFEGRQAQVWIVSEKDLDSMYSKFKADSEILLWVEIVEHHDSDDSDEKAEKVYCII